MFTKLMVYQLFAVFAGDANYKIVGSFLTEVLAAEASEALKKSGVSRVKTVVQPVVQNTEDPLEIYALGAPVVLVNNLDDLERRRAILKLTTRERELLGISE